MTLVSKAVPSVAAKSRAEARETAALQQLSGVAAFSVTGICSSLIVLNLSGAGEWLALVANGF